MSDNPSDGTASKAEVLDDLFETFSRKSSLITAPTKTKRLKETVDSTVHKEDRFLDDLKGEDLDVDLMNGAYVTERAVAE